MDLQIDIKNGDTLIRSLTSINKIIELHTKNCLLGDNIIIDIYERPAGLDYLCFTAKAANSTITCPQAFAYSTDKINWSIASTSSAITLTNIGDTIYLKRGNYTVHEESYSSIGTFTLSGNIKVSGNIMSLLDETCTRLTMPSGGGTFENLFLEQTALTDASQLKLPATTLSQWCYAGLLRETSITIPPALPATTLADTCYGNMFMACPLTTLPALVATDYPDSCCVHMLSGWPTTFSVFTASSAEHPYEWRIPMTGTAGTKGTNALANIIDNNEGGDAPVTLQFDTTYYVANQPIVPEQTIPNYLCFTANTTNSTILFPAPFECSTDKENWTAASTTTAITLANVGDKLYVRNGSVGAPGFESGYGTFTMTGSIAASGNIMSLIDNMVASTSLSIDGSFNALFKGCTSLTSAPELPATTVSLGAYYEMFKGCTNLRTGPSNIPATTLANYCCYGMFYNCSSLIQPPVLSATILGESAFSYMFYGCSSLTTVPHIGASTFGKSSCYGMFAECTSLTKVNALVTTNFPQYCCTGMYYACSQLILSETQSSTTPYAWTMPMTGSATAETAAFDDIFSGCQSPSGSWSVNTTIYSNLEPI